MQTTSQGSGIKSLNDRVAVLESQAGTALSFADQLISATATSIKTDLNTVLQHYEEQLISAGIDINDFKLTDLITAIPITITYVEKNAGIIAGILKKDVTSEFKLNTALTLIKQYIKQDEEFLIKWINHMVDLMFNKGTDTLANMLPNTKRSFVATPPSSISKGSRKKFSLFNKKS